MRRDYGTSHMGIPIHFDYASGTFDAMETIGSRIKQKRLALGIRRQSDLAVLVQVDQSTISDIERGANTKPEILLRIADALKTTPEWLIRGGVDDRLSKEGKSSVDAADTKVNTESPRQNIPTSAVFTPVNLSSTILLLGSLLARMDARSRRMMGVLLADLADAPDDAQDVADKASGIASKQKAVTSSKSLDAAIQGREGAFVETAPGQLE